MSTTCSDESGVAVSTRPVATVTFAISVFSGVSNEGRKRPTRRGVSDRLDQARCFAEGVGVLELFAPEVDAGRGLACL